MGIKRENAKIIKEAEEILEKIKEIKLSLEGLQREYEKELEGLKVKYYHSIESLKNELRKKEEELERFAIKHKAKLFVGDLAELRNGRLLLQVKEVVKRARGVLERLEALGWTEAIIVTKKVNWEVLEKWTDERLIAVGTERIIKESITYEIK